MSQTTVMQEPKQNKVESRIAHKSLTEGSVIAFINGHTDNKPQGSWLNVRPVVSCRFYRLNFYRSIQSLGDALYHDRMVESRFIEVVSATQGIEIITHNRVVYNIS